MSTGGGDLPSLGDLVAGKYVLRRVIGEGGMGIVFQAEHLRLRQAVAIKFLHPRYWNNSQVVARFDGEARAVARLRGVHVVRVLDVDVLPNGAPYIVQQSVLVNRECSSSLVEVETPKSRTRTSRRSVPGSSLRKRFPGFKSR